MQDMPTLTTVPTMPEAARRGAPSLIVLGTAGAALALVILGASVLLRLTTQWDSSGVAVSTLAPATERAVRLTHRLTASGVGLLAIVVWVLVWLRRRAPGSFWMPTAWMVGATVLLAAIGPLTPGYRYASVTVANVVAGTILLMSCWWLREAAALGAGTATARHPWLTAGVLAFLAHIGSGAAASAWEMRGLHWVAYLHIVSAIVLLFAVGEVLWERNGDRPLSRLATAMTVLLFAQMALGVMLMWLGRQPIWLGVVHALMSQVLATGLVSVVLRRGEAAA